jgi:multidrug resistance efflux pump
MKKYLLIAVAALVSLGIVLALVPNALPLLVGRGAAAQAMSEGDRGDADDSVDRPATQVGYHVVAEAVVVPVQEATLSMSASGIAAEVLVEEGSAVEAGQVILRLQNSHQRAAVARAEAALAAARAGLSALEAGPRSQEIASTQASLEAVQARLARLREGARPGEVAAAEADLKAAQATLQRLYDGPDEHTRIASGANLANAEAALRRAQAAYDQVAGRSDVDMLPQSLELQRATNDYEAAKASHDALFAAPDDDLVAGAQAQVNRAQANLDRLLEPATENEIAEVEAMVRQAEAQVDLLKAGARTEEIAAAKANVAEAVAGLQQAQASLADTELRAPFAGTLATLYVKQGEQVVAGRPVAELGDLTVWQVETDDLTELDIVGVQEGDEVVVTFDAIEGLGLAGTVKRIKPVGLENLGDITYTVVVRLEEQDPRLRWNMTAVVTFR